jgi:hypothetical protein
MKNYRGDGKFEGEWHGKKFSSICCGDCRPFRFGDWQLDADFKERM